MKSLCFSFSILILPLILSLSSLAFAHSFHNDRQSLLAFKKLVTRDPHKSMAYWSPAVPLCNWTAVTCSRRHPLRVVGLDLGSRDLGGSISPYLGNLSFLRSLDLSSNALHGHIPAQLGRLFRLKKLSLSDNQLEGKIPSQLSSCRSLAFLELSFNILSGNIPFELGSLTHLQELYLGANNFTVTAPFSGRSSLNKRIASTLIPNNHSVLQYLMALKLLQLNSYCSSMYNNERPISVTIPYWTLDSGGINTEGSIEKRSEIQKIKENEGMVSEKIQAKLEKDTAKCNIFEGKWI